MKKPLLAILAAALLCGCSTLSTVGHQAASGSTAALGQAASTAQGGVGIAEGIISTLGKVLGGIADGLGSVSKDLAPVPVPVQAPAPTSNPAP